MLTVYGCLDMPDLTKLRYEPMKEREERKTESLIDVVEEDRSAWKPYLLGFCTALFAFAFSYLVKDYFFEPRTFDLTTLQRGVFIAVSAAFFASLFFIQSVLVKNLSRLHTLSVFAVVALAAPFYSRISAGLAIGAFVLYAFLFFAAYTTWKELRLLVKIKFFRIGSRVLPKIITALALLISFVFYVNIQEGRTNILSKDLLNDLVFRPSEPLVVKIFPLFSFNKTGNEILSEMAAERIKSAPEAALLPVKKRNELAKTLQQELETRIESFAKTDINFSLPVHESIYEWLIQNLLHGTPASKLTTAASIAVVAFLILKTAGIVFSYAALFLSFILYEVLIAMEFATVVLESKTREIVLLK